MMTVLEKVEEIIVDMDLNRCELGEFNHDEFCFCQGLASSIVYRHPPKWYLDRPIDAQWALNQWLRACQWCKNRLLTEIRQKEVDRIFFEMRGSDVYLDRDHELLSD